MCYIAGNDLSRTIRKAIKSFEPKNEVQRQQKEFIISILNSSCDTIKFQCRNH